MELTKSQLQTLRLAIDCALAAVVNDHGLAQLRTGSCSYDKAGTFTFRLEGRLSGALTKEQQRNRQPSRTTTATRTAPGAVRDP